MSYQQLRAEFDQATKALTEAQEASENARQKLQAHVATQPKSTYEAALEKTKAKMDGYRGAAYEALNDLEYVRNAHASEYARRRRAEILKKLQEIENL